MDREQLDKRWLNHPKRSVDIPRLSFLEVVKLLRCSKDHVTNWPTQYVFLKKVLWDKVCLELKKDGETLLSIKSYRNKYKIV